MDILSGLAGTLITKGLDQWSESKEARWLKIALRDRLHREVKLNLEVWKLFRQNENKVDLARLPDLLAIDAFNAVCTLNLPLSALMGDQLLSDKVQRHLIRADQPKPNKNHQSWARSITTEVELIERIWHRLHVLKARQQLGGALGDNTYLIHLLKALDLCLQEHKGRTKPHKGKKQE